jgi:hypothetical protein
MTYLKNELDVTLFVIAPSEALDFTTQNDKWVMYYFNYSSYRASTNQKAPPP